MVALIDVSPSSKKNKFREGRLKRLLGLAEDYIRFKGSCSILDVGGTSGFWHTWKDEVNFEKIKITCVNLDVTHAAVKDFNAVTVEWGDATNLHAFADQSFDIAFSNSVIEHVGMWAQMERYAAEIKRVGRSYFVQTPYFWFPIEPHARTPFMHWLPSSLSHRIIMVRRCGYWPKASSVSKAMATVESARMLDAQQFGALFDDAVVSLERFIGYPKALIAVRHNLPT